jgi:rod shape-determining protein MreC
MGNIIFILFRIFPVLLFIGLELLALAILSKNNPYYNANITNRSNSFIGKWYNSIEDVRSYFGLKQLNNELAQQNSMLLTENFLIKSQLNTLIDTPMSSRIKSNVNLLNFEVFSAKIIYNSLTNTRNFFVINKGAADGIEEEMGVISQEGPVGIVISVSEHYATCMSLINQDANLSIKVKKSNQIGVLKWHGPGVQYGMIEDLPKHVTLKKGDIIETSGHSTYFPEGIQVGKVVKQTLSSEKDFAIVYVKLNNDFSKLKHVFVIKNNNSKELKGVLKNLDSLTQIKPNGK